MGYACPVCGSSQADGVHLANHLAFTALLHGDGDGHEAWLDDRVPGWSDLIPAELADAVAGYAEETDHETVFEDTTSGRRGFDPRNENLRRHGPSGAPRDLDPETRRIVEEAREMTRARQPNSDAEGSDTGGPSDDREE